jgi:transposase-like protein
MKHRKRKHDANFKSRLALEAIRGRYTPAELASAFDVNASLIHAWRKRLTTAAKVMFKSGAVETERRRNDELRRLDRRIAELGAEQEWMRQVVQALSLQDRRDMVDMENAGLSVLCQTRLLGLHRSGVYYKNKIRLSHGGGAESHSPPSRRSLSPNRAQGVQACP